MDFINIHTHIISKDFIPKDFLPFGIVRLLSSTKLTKYFAKFLNVIHPFTHDDLLDRYSNFIKTANHNQKQIFNILLKIYADNIIKNNKDFNNIILCILCLDLEYMQNNYYNNIKTYFKKNYEIQTEEISQLIKIYNNNIKAFYCVDPRRIDFYKNAKNAIENLNFTGFKIYPALGFYANDNRLKDLYRYSEELQIPIIYHCSKGGIYYKGDVSGWFNNNFQIKQNDCWKFTNPDIFLKIKDEFPKLKINLAHFGGENDWLDYIKGKNLKDNWVLKIINLLNNYNNIYTDISYIGYKKEVLTYIKLLLNTNIKNKILYGSDFYMIEIDKAEKEYINNVINIFNKQELKQIANINPIFYLNNLNI